MMRKNRNNVVPFPTVARPNIEEIFADFLKDQKPRLKPRSYRRYEEVMQLYRHCLNSYGAQDLDLSADVALYQRLYNYRELEFCTIFGPEKVLKNLPTFLHYFMIRKVMASEELLRAAGTVTKKLARWLVDHGYIEEREANTASRLASEASRELPAAERLARLLYEYAQSHAPRYWTDELDDYFVVEQIQPGKLLLSAVAGDSGVIEVKVPQEITDHCKVGWHINLLLGETRHGWRILETGNVYPKELW
jgi:hypothetical protein